jgi:hypothetical protein
MLWQLPGGFQSRRFPRVQGDSIVRNRPAEFLTPTPKRRRYRTEWGVECGVDHPPPPPPPFPCPSRPNCTLCLLLLIDGRRDQGGRSCRSLPSSPTRPNIIPPVIGLLALNCTGQSMVTPENFGHDQRRYIMRTPEPVTTPSPLHKIFHVAAVGRCHSHLGE